MKQPVVFGERHTFDTYFWEEVHSESEDELASEQGHRPQSQPAVQGVEVGNVVLIVELKHCRESDHQDDAGANVYQRVQSLHEKLLRLKHRNLAL